MKSDPLTGTLVGVLAVSVLASIFYFYSYVNKTRDLRQTQAQVNYITQRRPYIVQMINEVLEYSKTHPAVDPILESTGIKPKPGASAAKPTTK
jgi:hypothetical protein